ncbi:ethylbenzene dehydrogenase-related protein [Zhongshania aliphaticivorans]|nr:ethylbenzene dehydrogenase-related protein [Zhongshania aliphaticivorans]
MHLLLLFGLLAAFFSGMRIAAAGSPDSWAAAIDFLLPLGSVYQWHSWVGISLIFLAFGYIAYLAMSQRWRKYIISPRNPIYTAENLSKLIIWLGWLLLASSLFTGYALYSNAAPHLQHLLRTIHYIAAWSYLSYLILHIAALIAEGGWQRLLSIFRPRLMQTRISLISLGLAAIIGVAIVGLGESAQKDSLTIHYSAQKIDLDGEARESIWNQINPTTVNTTKSGEQSLPPLAVNIRAIHDNHYVYFLISWPDATQSLKHLPLIKTAEGWKIMQTQATVADENTFYEDKLALMLSASSEIAGAGTVHLGAQPLKNQPNPAAQRGLHYTLDGSITDVWHWKAVRTGLSIGQADDNYFGPPLPSTSEIARYTGGYQKDPDCEHLLRWENHDYRVKDECGGYIMNWELYEEGIIQPRRLPNNPKQIQHLQTISLSADTSDKGRWWMRWQDTNPYSTSADTLPVGSIMPSVLSLGKFSGDRGDIDSGAQWRNGSWTLELKRKLNTGSKFDLAVMDDVYLWLAVFDHSQIRHSYHLHPLRLVLEDADNNN